MLGCTNHQLSVWVLVEMVCDCLSIETDIVCHSSLLGLRMHLHFSYPLQGHYIKPQNHISLAQGTGSTCNADGGMF